MCASLHPYTDLTTVGKICGYQMDKLIRAGDTKLPHKGQCYVTMDQQFVCIKDKFGNDRWYVGEELRLFPVPEIISLEDQVNRIRNIDLRADDVVIVGYPRSGNNWLHQLVYMLLEGALDPPPVYGPDSYINLESATDKWRLPPPGKRRAFYTHLLFKDLPLAVKDKKVRIVHIARDPKDVIVSLYCLTEKMLPIHYHPPWAQFFATMLDDGHWYGTIFNHLTNWGQTIDGHPDHSIYSLTYEELTQDTVGHLEKLDQFLETHRGRQFCQDVANKCNVGNMTELRMAQDSVLNRDMLYRKGVVGDWKNWFTVAQNEEYKEVYRRKMAGSRWFRLYDQD